jgi:hypothetical protein
VVCSGGEMTAQAFDDLLRSRQYQRSGAHSPDKSTGRRPHGVTAMM